MGAGASAAAGRWPGPLRCRVAEDWGSRGQRGGRRQGMPGCCATRRTVKDACRAKDERNLLAHKWAVVGLTRMKKQKQTTPCKRARFFLAAPGKRRVSRGSAFLEPRSPLASPRAAAMKARTRADVLAAGIAGDLDAAGHVDPVRPHLFHRRGDVPGIQGRRKPDLPRPAVHARTKRAARSRSMRTPAPPNAPGTRGIDDDRGLRHRGRRRRH